MSESRENATLTEDELREIKERCGAAIPDRWFWKNGSLFAEMDSLDKSRSKVYCVLEAVEGEELEPKILVEEDDAEFMARAREDVPRLIRALEAETEARKEAEERIGELEAEKNWAHRNADEWKEEARCRKRVSVEKHERLKELKEENRRMREAMKTLQKEYEKEAEEYGFPFNFQLRDAHREMLRLLEVLEEGERDRTDKGE